MHLSDSLHKNSVACGLIEAENTPKFLFVLYYRLPLPSEK